MCDQESLVAGPTEMSYSRVVGFVVKHPLGSRQWAAERAKEQIPSLF